jgi:hypothetical protein
MKYLPMINLGDNANYTALLQGNLKLQSGQWVHFNDPTQPSRFDYTENGRYVRAYHYPRATTGYMYARVTVPRLIAARRYRAQAEQMLAV